MSDPLYPRPPATLAYKSRHALQAGDVVGSRQRCAFVLLVDAVRTPYGAAELLVALPDGTIEERTYLHGDALAPVRVAPEAAPA